MEINIHVKSSSHPDKPYKVLFLHKDGKVSVLCDCPAGEWGKLCKHKLALIGKDTKMLYAYDEADLLLDAHDLIRQTSLMDAYSNFEVRCKEIEALCKEIEAQKHKLKKKLTGIKKQMGKLLHDGVE